MSPPAPRQRSAAEIESDIALTRAELGRTIDALAQHLDTRQLLHKGFAMIADSVGGNRDFHLGEAIRANPIPLALIGLGVAWLVAANTNVIDSVAADERVQAARRRISGLASQVGDKVGETLGVTGNPQIDGPSGRPGNGWIHHASDAARDALRSVRDTGGAVIERAGEFAEDAAAAARLPPQVSRTFLRHPLLVGGLVAIAGAAVAALLPASRVEDEWLGETRDNLRGRAGAIAREAVERVRNLAEDTAR